MPFFSYRSIPESSPMYLEPFSLPHIVALSILAVASILVVAFRKRLAAWKGEPTLRLVATIVAISFEAALHVPQYFTQGWHDFLRGAIPFELCAVALRLAVALNASKSRGVWDLLYFWGLGAAASYVFATLLKAIGVLFPITIALRFFDSAFSGPPLSFNFMFLISPPDVPTPLDGFGHGWGYYFGLHRPLRRGHGRGLAVLGHRRRVPRALGGLARGWDRERLKSFEPRPFGLVGDDSPGFFAERGYPNEGAQARRRRAEQLLRIIRQTEEAGLALGQGSAPGPVKPYEVAQDGR